MGEQPPLVATPDHILMFYRFAPDGREAQTFQGELLPVAAGEARQRHLSQPTGPCTGWHTTVFPASIQSKFKLKKYGLVPS